MHKGNVGDHPRRLRVPRRAGVLAALALGAAAALAPAAGAHTSTAGEDGYFTVSETRQVVGHNARLQPNGLYQFRAGGAVFQTHGPDPITVDSHGTSMDVGDPERVPVCTTSTSSYHQRILYAYNQGTANRLATVTPHIQAAIRRMDHVLDEESVISGGPHADYRVFCAAGGAIKVDAFVVPPASGGGSQSSFGNIVAAARAAGYTSPNVDYTIFYDASDSSGLACGVGSFWGDDRAIAGNYNNNPGGSVQGGYAVTYGPYSSPTSAGCWYGHTPMHENGHNQGAVQAAAPFSTGTGAHCWDEIDVMCYSPDGGNVHQGGTVTYCSASERFDCRNDSYFDTAPETGEWLATHWNIGSTLNRFIVRGGTAPNQPPKPAMNANCTGLACTFRDRSVDPDGTIASRLWNFGDTTSTSATPSKTFGANGSYPVSLRATDNDGAQATVIRYVAVASTGVPALGNGKTTIDGAKAQGTFRMFRVSVPAGRTQLVVQQTGAASADLDLYVRRGAQPTTSAYDCRPFESDANETCTIANPASGSWYIGIHNYDAPTTSPLTIKATSSG